MSFPLSFRLRERRMRSAHTWLAATCLALTACGQSPASDDGTKPITGESADDPDRDAATSADDDYVPDDMRDGGAAWVRDSGGLEERAPNDAGRLSNRDASSPSDAALPSSRDGSVGGPAQSGGLVRGAAPTEATASRAGPYRVKTYTNGYRQGSAYFDSTIHYPEDAEPPFALMTIVPGFVSPQASIQNWGPFLASHGIVTMTIGTVTPADPPPVRELALMDALQTLESENERAGSPLNGKLDLRRQAVGGWSMGGGGALLAGEHNAGKLKAVMAICPWNPVYSYAGVEVPSLMFAGTLDVLAGGQSQGFYQTIPNSTPKLLWEVNGADHWYANDPAGQGGAVGRYGLSFLKVFLEGDERYRALLRAKGPNASDFRTNI